MGYEIEHTKKAAFAGVTNVEKNEENVKPTIGTLFTGGGLFLAGLKDQLNIAWGVEYDAAIADCYRANIGDKIIVSRVQDVNPMALEPVDILQASPVCKEFSAAKTNGKESAEEISQAQAIVNFIEVMRPKVFILENVRGYMKSKSYAMIVVKLSRLGYMISSKVLNAADYGVPQTRQRLILRATLDRAMPALPDVVEWVGWYEAIEDLISTLPESQFADWQLERLPETNKTHLLAAACNGSNPIAFRSPEKPSWVLTTSTGGARAFLIPGDNTSNGVIRDGIEPSHTIAGNVGVKHTYPKAWLSQGRVVKMTPRALARFQSLPDWYQLPEKDSLACTIIGNGVPPKLASAVVQPFLKSA